MRVVASVSKICAIARARVTQPHISHHMPCPSSVRHTLSSHTQRACAQTQRLHLVPRRDRRWRRLVSALGSRGSALRQARRHLPFRLSRWIGEVERGHRRRRHLLLECAARGRDERVPGRRAAQSASTRSTKPRFSEATQLIFRDDLAFFGARRPWHTCNPASPDSTRPET